MKSKSALRQEMCQRLARISTEEKHLAGIKLVKHLIRHDDQGDVVLFKSRADEIDLAPLTRWFESQGVKLFYPRYTPGNPELEFDCDWDRVSLLMVPGLAFDRCGNRLGRGLGCYDRLLARLDRKKIRVIGICMDCQLLDKIPVDSHDEKVDKVCTNERTT